MVLTNPLESNLKVLSPSSKQENPPKFCSESQFSRSKDSQLKVDTWGGKYPFCSAFSTVPFSLFFPRVGEEDMSQRKQAYARPFSC